MKTNDLHGMGQSNRETDVPPTTPVTSGSSDGCYFPFRIKINFISPLIAAFKIEAVNQDSTALVIKINDIYDGTETSINNVFTNINLGTSAIKNLSRILSVKPFRTM